MRVREKGPCPKCGQQPCVCEKKPSRVITVVKLADGKERTIEHMTCTTFWHPDGTHMSAQKFIESLYSKLPDFFKDKEELLNLWSDPETRKKQMQGLSEK